MAVDVEVPRRLFTVEEYHRMAEAGILDADERVELIEGEVIRMAPRRSPALRMCDQRQPAVRHPAR